MKLPYVIDSQTHVLADILKGLLTEHKGRSLDVATAYFTVGGFGALQESPKSARETAHRRPVGLGQVNTRAAAHQPG